MKRRLALFAVVVFALPSACAIGSQAPPPTLDMPLSELTVVTASGAHEFEVWVAADDPSRSRGLMHVRSMAADRGMLFLFEPPQYVAFWMKDTYLSLDLAFIDAEGRVVNVAERATPLSLAPIESALPVRAVLEVNAGTARRIGLKAGDRIQHPSLRTTSAQRRRSPAPPDARSAN